MYHSDVFFQFGEGSQSKTPAKTTSYIINLSRCDAIACVYRYITPSLEEKTASYYRQILSDDAFMLCKPNLNSNKYITDLLFSSVWCKFVCAKQSAELRKVISRAAKFNSLSLRKVISRAAKFNSQSLRKEIYSIISTTTTFRLILWYHIARERWNILERYFATP